MFPIVNIKKLQHAYINIFLIKIKKEKERKLNTSIKFIQINFYGSKTFVTFKWFNNYFKT
ncbi:hypothetical protein PFUGPA_04657 [Plasmodium falciparum Palo Alto/Uganda]|uniref:Uncharacterized protein n=2 Tax=Plasmodium falciparum TaxID=5833 RepID=W4IUP3_PLAFP|nr:hypothetical protein PFTANZ_01649 [Plasmodium falciparum Tanzania (2000708)]ETW53031.1 hypothetical protein PFUGPA_04657 [Plasmodium falciparum Palo Alto/Uganda]